MPREGLGTMNFWYTYWYIQINKPNCSYYQFWFRIHSSKISWTRLLNLLAKTLKNTREWIRYWNLQLTNFVIRTFSKVLFQGFCLKVSEDFFHRTPPCILVVIVNRLRTVFFKIIQNCVNNKVTNQKLLVS